MIDDENAQVGHILTDLYRKQTGSAGDVGQENRPEFAIVEERGVEEMPVALPVILDGLQSRGRTEQQIGLHLAWICNLPRDIFIRFCTNIHNLINRLLFLKSQSTSRLDFLVQSAA